MPGPMRFAKALHGIHPFCLLTPPSPHPPAPLLALQRTLLCLPAAARPWPACLHQAAAAQAEGSSQGQVHPAQDTQAQPPLAATNGGHCRGSGGQARFRGGHAGGPPARCHRLLSWRACGPACDPAAPCARPATLCVHALPPLNCSFPRCCIASPIFSAILPFTCHLCPKCSARFASLGARAPTHATWPNVTGRP
jgi:hypothetical protein